MPIRLIYASRATQPVKAEDIRQILKASHKNNGVDQITGMLCYGQGRFLQVLEGERGKINDAYFRIMQDKRHDALILLAYEEVSSASFGKWSMGYVGAEDPETRQIIQSTTTLDDFLPEQLSSVEAVNLTKALTKRITPQIGFE